MRRLVFLFCILLLNTSLYAVEKREIVIREVGIQVVDAETGLPVPDLVVYSSVTTYTLSLWTVLGVYNTDFLTKYHYEIDKFVTDQNGFVLIPEKRIHASKYQYLDNQTIYINVDVLKNIQNDEEKSNILFHVNSKSDYKNYLYSPNENYKIVEIASFPDNPTFSKSERSNEEYHLAETDEYLQYIYNPHEHPNFTDREWMKEPRSFFCGREEFVIKLEKREDNDSISAKVR